MNKGDGLLTLKFSAMQWCYWSLWGSFLTFAGMYMGSRGAGYSVIGTALSLAILGGIAGQVFWGFLCDKLKNIKYVLICAHIILWLIIMSFMLVISSGVMFGMYALLGFCLIPMVGLLDSWIIQKGKTAGLNYGFIRLWASAGFTVNAIILGRLINFFGYNVMFIAVTLYAAVIIFLASITSDASIVRVKIKLKKEYSGLLANKRFLTLLVGGFLIGLCLEGIDKLMAVIVQNIGGSAGDYGLIVASASLMEIPSLFLSGKLIKRFGMRNIFLIAVSIYIAQYIILSIADSVPALMLCMAFQGIAFGLWLPNLRAFVDANATENMRTSAQTLTDGVTGGAAGVIAVFTGARVIEIFGVRAMSVCLIILMACAALVLLNVKSTNAIQG